MVFFTMNGTETRTLVVRMKYQDWLWQNKSKVSDKCSICWKDGDENYPNSFRNQRFLMHRIFVVQNCTEG